ncbi:MAG: hypothetical protein ABIR68_00165 [Ilumatobacteraceae bacterium]
MSFDIFLQSFRDGEGGAGDGDAALALLEPFVVRRENGCAQIATADGGADVYGLDDAATGLMINHVSGRAIYSLLYDIARCARFVVMPVGCATCVSDEAMKEHLPSALANDVVVIASGDALQRIIESG